MTIKTTIGALKQALQCVLKAVNTKQITAEFKDGKLMLHACANEGHAKAYVASNGMLPDMVFPITGKLVLTIINNCEADQLCTISQQADGLRLKFGGASIKLTRYSEKEVEFFNWSAKDDVTSIIGNFDADILRAALKSVAKLYSEDASRYQLRGVYFQSINNRLVLAATNGMRLAENITDIEVGEFAPMIIGGEYVEALASIVSGGEFVKCSVVGTASPTAVIFATSKFSIKCPLIGGLYPDYRSVIPVTNMHTSVKASALVAALERMYAVSSTLSNHFVKINFKSGAVSVATVDEESTEQIDAHGDEFNLMLGFQPQLLVGLLASVTTEDINLGVTFEKGSESFMTVTNSSKDGWLGLVTPARV